MAVTFRQVLTSLATKAPEIAANKLVSETERLLRDAVCLRPEDRKRSRKLVPSMRRSDEVSDWVKLTGPPGRGAFLAACLAFLRSKPEEWAIVGLGTAARRSFVKEVFVRRGKAGSVGLPVSIQAQIGGHLASVAGAEIIHVHNHPGGVARDLKNLFLGEAPVTSDADRAVQQAHVDVARTGAATTMTPRNVRFYLVENGDLHLYWLPSSGPLRDEMERLVRGLLSPLAYK